MGYGSYTSKDWEAFRVSARITDTATANQIFKKTSISDSFNPANIALREARDSSDHPQSTPVIIGLDVTGSMGFLAEEIAKNSLNETMLKLYDMNPIPDPQLMFSAIGDVDDKAPLQVTQFESDIRIGQQLLQLWLEQRGGDTPEDYPLLWYFAAKHTVTDSWQLRQKKGYLITIGDADCHEYISARSINKIFCGASEEKNYSASELAGLAGETYQLFHIHLTEACNGNVPLLRTAIPGRVLSMSKHEVKLLPEVIISLLQIAEGMDIQAAARQWAGHESKIMDILTSLQLNHRNRAWSF